jgi:hypothetical protein
LGFGDWNFEQRTLKGMNLKQGEGLSQAQGGRVLGWQFKLERDMLVGNVAQSLL